MKVRIACVDEINFLKCFKYKIWGANKVSQNNWEIGDKLIFKIGNKIVGLATVSGELYVDNLVIWENGLFWSRIPLSFNYVFETENAIDFNKHLRDLFLEKWGYQYGWVILNKKTLPENIVIEMLNAFMIPTNQLEYFETNIDNLLK